MASRCHCFTLWLDEFVVPDGAESLRGLVVQKEISPTTGKQHWQGYAEFTKPIRGKQACLTLGLEWPKKGSKSVHFENARGTRSQAAAYCLSTKYCSTHNCGDFMLQDGLRIVNMDFCDCADTKDKGAIDEPIIHGRWPEAIKDGGKSNGGGTPNAYKEMMTDVKSGLPLTAIKRKHADTYARYHGGVEKVAQAFVTPKTWKPWVCWLSGEAGTGKSRCASNLGESVFNKSSGNKWFDGYEGQTVAVLDDFRKHWFPYDFLLKLLDHGECQVEVKGGMVQWRPKMVIITCHKHWRELFKYKDEDGVHEREDILQLSRRIDYNADFPVDDWRRIRWRIRQAIVYEDDQSDSEDGWKPTEASLPEFYHRPKKAKTWANTIADREYDGDSEEALSPLLFI